jgi:D-sedoheptulose 7-phosphate isomerase
MKNEKKIILNNIKEHEVVFKNIKKNLINKIYNAAQTCIEVIKSKKKIIFFGNGGSAADAQHLATELVIRFEKNRKPISSISLSTDTSLITACSNDFSFNKIFSKQIEAIGEEGDLAIAISTSGKSKNVIDALKVCKNKKIKSILLTGKNKFLYKNYCNHIINIPSKSTARIQEAHIFVGHLICKFVEDSVIK